MSATTNIERELGPRTIPTATAASATTSRATAQTTVHTTIVTPVDFGCPRCGDERTGLHVMRSDGAAWIECQECTHRADPSLLDIPSAETLERWYAQALRHGRAALRCADGSPTCSQLAIMWCRRLAPELTPIGKINYLERIARPLPTSPTRQQREVLIELGASLGMAAAPLNALVRSL